MQEPKNNSWKKFPRDHEYLWDKIKRERQEDHPKYVGGQYLDTDMDLSYHFRRLAIKEGLV